MGKPSLKAKMPRVFPDHRSHEANRLRRTYDDLVARFQNLDGIARRVALLVAQAWLSYEDLGIELEQGKRKRRTAQDLSRLRRRRQTAAGQFLAGLRSLEALTATTGRGLDLARAIQDLQQQDREDGHAG